MGAVEEADLHVFVGEDVGGDDDAGGRGENLEDGAAINKLVFDDPLPEGLGRDDVRGGFGVGGDAIDHGVGERDVGLDPVREAVVGGELGELHDGLLEDVAVAWDVVERHEGEAGHAGGAPCLEGLDDEAVHGLGAGAALRGEVVLEFVVHFELAGLEVAVVALFGDREGADAGLRVDEVGERLFGLDAHVDEVDDGADVGDVGLCGGVRADLIREAGGGEELDHVDGARSVAVDADDAPLGGADGGVVIVDEGREMRAAEVAEADVDDRAAERCGFRRRVCCRGVGRHFEVYQGTEWEENEACGKVKNWGERCDVTMGLKS
mmetsp:Transcript_26467/g.66286  ORF Transcript_26467/g.66286 Transcript_26467/m.66286 type:complete len:322 (-) Transcript_26467:28-993(-)